MEVRSCKLTFNRQNEDVVDVAFNIVLDLIDEE